MSFAFEKFPRISLDYKLVPVQYRGHKYGVLPFYKNSSELAQCVFYEHLTSVSFPYDRRNAYTSSPYQNMFTQCICCQSVFALLCNDLNAHLSCNVRMEHKT